MKTITVDPFNSRRVTVTNLGRFILQQTVHGLFFFKNYNIKVVALLE